MCGRARCTLAPEDVGAACGFHGRQLRTVGTERYRPSYNVSPGAHLPVVRYDASGEAAAPEEPVVQCMKWGLVPSFSKKNEKPDHYRMFNARSETVRQKSSFSRLIPKRRCLLSVEGFYEWKKDGGKKQPYYIHFQDGHPLVLACLYDTWQDAEGETLFTFTILTTHVSKRLEWLHDRMPVILGTEEAMEAWIKSAVVETVFEKFIRPFEGANLVWYPVTSSMGKPTFDGPECIQELKLKPPAPTNDISRFFKRKPQPGDDSGSDEKKTVEKKSKTNE